MRKFQIILYSGAIFYRNYSNYKEAITKAKLEFAEKVKEVVLYTENTNKNNHKMNFIKKAISNVPKYLHKQNTKT